MVSDNLLLGAIKVNKSRRAISHFKYIFLAILKYVKLDMLNVEMTSLVRRGMLPNSGAQFITILSRKKKYIPAYNYYTKL